MSTALKWRRTDPGSYRSMAASPNGGYLRFRVEKQEEGGWTAAVYRREVEIDSTWMPSKYEAQRWAESRVTL